MIYVDELKEYGWIIRGRKIPSCHMFSSEGLEDLHLFAKRLGMKREWFQDKKNFPHYDLVPARRRLAVGLGAIETTTKEWMKKERAQLVMGFIEQAFLEVILAPEFSKIEKELSNKIDEEAFALGGVYTQTANTLSSNPPCSLTLKDLEIAHKKINESIPKHKLLPENVINEAEIEILLPDAVDIKRDKNGKILSFMCWGVHFTTT